MSRELIFKKNLYYSVIGGTFRVQVPQDHPEAVRRDWKSADGKSSGTKYEREVSALFGRIEDIQFHDGEFGMNINIQLDENEEGEHPMISLGAATREGEDFLKKLPNIDLAKEVRLRPFNFTGEANDEVRGIEVMQQDENGEFNVKITNFFVEQVKQADGSFKRTMKNGFPVPEGDTEMYSKDEWKLYFLKARMFLINYAKQNILPKFTKSGVARPPQSLEEQENRENLDPDQIPF